MSWNPQGIITAPSLVAGTYPACILSEFSEAPPSKAGKYQAAWIAVYRETGTNAEVQDWLKFDGTSKDYYSGLRMERLHAIMGVELGDSVNCNALLAASNGILFTVEITATEKAGKTYYNIADVQANDTAGSDGDIPF